MMLELERKINELTISDNKLAYKALKELLQLSEETEEVYQYMNTFIEMMDNNENSYIRTRGISLIASNAKWDKDNKINEIIEKYLKHIEDEKPITSRQCIKELVTVSKYKPELIEDILKALETYNKIYEGSMQSLIYNDRKKAIRQIRQYL